MLDVLFLCRGDWPHPDLSQWPHSPTALSWKPGEEAPPQCPPRLAAVTRRAQELPSEPSRPQGKEGLGPRWQIADLVAMVFLWACLLPSEAFLGPSAQPPETLQALQEAFVGGALASWPVVPTPSTISLPACLPWKGRLGVAPSSIREGADAMFLARFRRSTHKTRHLSEGGGSFTPSSDISPGLPVACLLVP